MAIAITESSTLVILILLSCCYFRKIKINQITGDFNLKGITRGAFITIFTFTGFEAIAKLAEETKESKKAEKHKRRIQITPKYPLHIRA